MIRNLKAKRDEIFDAKNDAAEKFLVQCVRWCAFSIGIKPQQIRKDTVQDGVLARHSLLVEVQAYLGKDGMGYFTEREVENAIWQFAKRRSQ